jgi:hypothetical protein
MLISPNLACRRVPGSVCSVRVCVSAFLLSSVGRGITSPCFAYAANDQASAMGGRVSGLVWPLNIERWFRGRGRRTKERACQSMMQCVIESTVWPDRRRRWCKMDVVAMGWCCPTHTGNEVSSCVGGVVGRSCAYFVHEEAVWFKWDCL